jgi:uncharacterized protein with ParB-like and HNH nuclease domain
LWEDIENLQEEEHYMGYIVLQRNKKDKRDKNNFSIIDGQQRLITLSLFVLAAMSKIQTLIEQNVIFSIKPTTSEPDFFVIFLQKNSKQFDINLSVLVRFLFLSGAKSSVRILNLTLLFLFKVSLL